MPSQNPDDILKPSGEHRTRHLLERVQQRSAKLLDPSTSRILALLETAQSQLSPHLESLTEWLLDTQRIEQLQGALSHVANAAISVGFHIDPGAALLFDFISWLEEEHGKPQVFPRVLQNAPLDEPAFLRLMTRSITAQASRTSVDASPDTHDPDVLRVRAHLLHMLCSLTQLEEEDAPLPAKDDIPAMLAYLERAILPERFDLLPGLAAGRQDAFDKLLERRHRARQEQGEQASIKDKLKLAMLDRLLPPSAKHTPHDEASAEEAATSTSLSRSVRSPALTFLTSGYLLFLHTTLTRAALESFPDLIEGLKQAEHDAATQREREDAIDISPPEK